METKKCNNPNCKKELIHTEGRRKKIYCSAACKNKINTANYFERNKEKVKTIRISIEEYKKLIEQIAENNKPKNKEDNNIDKETKNMPKNNIKKDELPKIKGESSLDYKIRLDEWLANKKATK
jgi:hypothetical protein